MKTNEVLKVLSLYIDKKEYINLIEKIDNRLRNFGIYEIKTGLISIELNYYLENITTIDLKLIKSKTIIIKNIKDLKENLIILKEKEKEIINNYKEIKTIKNVKQNQRIISSLLNRLLKEDKIEKINKNLYNLFKEYSRINTYFIFFNDKFNEYEIEINKNEIKLIKNKKLVNSFNKENNVIQGILKQI
jgi:hypothetical protein